MITVQQNPDQYWQGYNKVFDFASSLRRLAKISSEDILLEFYGKRLVKMGHIAELKTVNESYLWGVLRGINAINRLDTMQNEHFGLMFDGDSDWIQVFYCW